MMISFTKTYGYIHFILGMVLYLYWLYTGEFMGRTRGLDWTVYTSIGIIFIMLDGKQEKVIDFNSVKEGFPL